MREWWGGGDSPKMIVMGFKGVLLGWVRIVGIEGEMGQSTCPIRHEHTKVWGRGVDQFYELARENTKRLFPA